MFITCQQGLSILAPSAMEAPEADSEYQDLYTFTSRHGELELEAREGGAPVIYQTVKGKRDLWYTTTHCIS